MARIFVTFSPQMRKNYYGDKALAGLQALGEVELNPGARALSTHELIEAACRCEFIVSDRQTPGEGELFRRLPDIVAFASWRLPWVCEWWSPLLVKTLQIRR